MKIRISGRTLNETFTGNLKWYLSQEVIYLGGASINDVLEETFKGTKGSSDWLWLESDVFRFNQENELIFAKLNVTSEVFVLNDSYNGSIDGIKVSIGCMSTKTFPSLYPDSVTYFEQNDILQAKYRLDGGELFYVTEDLAFILKEEVMFGWVLRNASSYIFPCENESINQTRPESLKLLVEYLGLCNDASYKLMDDESEEMKVKLDELLAKVTNDQSNISEAIKESLGGLIEGYY